MCSRKVNLKLLKSKSTTFSNLEQDEVEKEMNHLRNEQHKLVKELKDLEMDKMPQGFDLKPMNPNEMNVLKNEFKLK